MRSAAVQTPSKRNGMDTITEEEEEETLKPERTPASSGKRFMLSNLFATPTTLRYAAMAEGLDHGKAENGNQPDHKIAEDPAVSGTPSFLRRSNSGRYGNGMSNIGLSPTAVRKPQQFVGKGLSALVQGLRDMEEERMEDDMDVLREIEANQAAANVEVNDSQAQNDAAPRPKKKGQKRTTRRVTMRPVVVQRPTRASQAKEVEDDSDNGEEKGASIAVPETQLPDAATRAEGEDQQDDNDDDAASLHTMSEPDVGSDSDSDYAEEPEVSTKSKSFSEKMKEAISSVAKPPPKAQEKPSQPKATKEEKENQKPRARKVNPDAHANYRSLKIHKKGGKGRFGGRFGRR